MAKQFTFTEDFNDGILNTGGWSYHDRSGAFTPTKITEHDGYLDIQMTETDNEAHAVYTFDQGVVDANISMERFYHAANSYYMGNTSLVIENALGEEFRISLAMVKSSYGPDYGSDFSNFDHPRITISHVDSGTDRYFASNVTSALFDTWSMADIRIDNTAGSIWMDFDGDGNSDLTFTDASLVGASLTGLDFSSYGWWTGHYSYMDSLSVTGTVDDASANDFTEAEIQEFGALWKGLKLANKAYSDAMKGVVEGYRDLNPNFDKNSTGFEAIFETSIWESVGLYGDKYNGVEYADFIKATQQIESKNAFMKALRDGNFTLGVDGVKALKFAGDFIEIADTVKQGFDAINGLRQEADIDGAFETVEGLTTSLLAGGLASVIVPSGIGVSIAGIAGTTGLASLMVVGGVTIVVGLGAGYAAKELITAVNEHYRISEGATAWYQTALIEVATNGVFRFSSDTTPQTVIGDFLISGGQGDDNLTGGAHNDNISGSGGDDVLDGRAGADTMYGGTGDDIYIVDNVGDRVIEVDLSFFSEDIDTVRASVSFKAPTDVDNIVLLGKKDINADGNHEDNTIWGNGGNNRISTARGADTVYAKGGDDIVIAANDLNEDNYFGGKGNDTLVFSPANSIRGVVISLEKTVAHTSFGTEHYFGFENLTGTQSGDVLVGDKDSNILTGRKGTDVLRGAGGADTLIGGANKDTMYAGNDNAEDVFVFNATSDSKKGFTGQKADKILGFDTGEDKLDLSAIDANTRLAGNQAFDMEIVSSTPISHGIWVKYTTQGNVLVYADVNGDHKADMLIKLIDLDSISVGDFII